MAESTLQELLKLYTRVLGEVRALDAEKKALVYDNYSKLITATETIRKVCIIKTRRVLRVMNRDLQQLTNSDAS